MLDKLQTRFVTKEEAMAQLLREDNLYTYLYAYVRKFAPSAHYMVYVPDDEPAESLLRKAHDAAKELDRLQMNSNRLSAFVERIEGIVKRHDYQEALALLQPRIDRVEEDIRRLDADR